MAQEKKIEVMVRVDHAGEYGALRIYQGQSALWRGRNKRLARQIDDMAAHEKEHFDYFEKKLARDHMRPTIFLPVWHIAGFMLGAATAMAGHKAAMACTQAVEEVIDEHYTRQIEDLAQPQEEEFKQAITQFRDDERAHHDIALEQGADNFPLMRAGIGMACRIAIALSSRF